MLRIIQLNDCQEMSVENLPHNLAIPCLSRFNGITTALKLSTLFSLVLIQKKESK